jgi:putative DNA primase/helicase
MTTPMLDAAIAYGRAGYRVHPCSHVDKRPLTQWSLTAATDETKIRYLWHLRPDSLIGLCTGDGLVVIDDDRGREEPEDDLAATRTAKTRSRGYHHYFTTDARVGNRVGIIPGVDIRGDGGYVIAPPSPGWEWFNDGPMQPLPQWVLTIAAAEEEKKRLGPGFEPAPAGSIGEGHRHDYMVRFAGFAIRTLEFSGDDLVINCWHEYQRACSPADAPFENIRRIARSIEQRDRRR